MKVLRTSGLIALVGLGTAQAQVPQAPQLAAELAGPLAREKVVRIALAHHPTVQAAEARAHAATTAADAEGRLPNPEVGFDLWQVPLARPYAIGDAQMAMVSLRQRFPASLGAREDARRAESRAEEASLADRRRLLARDVGHAFVDYREAHERHRVHGAHVAVMSEMLAVAARRHEAGGALLEWAQADLDLARAQVDQASDGAKSDANRARLNTLLLRPPAAPLGVPMDEEPLRAAWDLSTLLAEARKRRPEVQAATAQREAKEHDLRAAEREATIPAFSVGLLYFVPVGPMPTHGVGVSLSAELPWLWGGANRRAQAQGDLSKAARHELDAELVRSDAEVAAWDAAVRAASIRLTVLRDRALPAAQRAADVAWAGVDANRADLRAVVQARRSVVDTEVDIVSTRAMLDHALIDLDSAVGISVPRSTGALAPSHHP
ncbi:MAG: TolC family protein [Myxococcales bacterium]